MPPVTCYYRCRFSPSVFIYLFNFACAFVELLGTCDWRCFVLDVVLTRLFVGNIFFPVLVRVGMPCWGIVHPENGDACVALKR